jgi:hypothetical protein
MRSQIKRKIFYFLKFVNFKKGTFENIFFKYLIQNKLRFAQNIAKFLEKFTSNHYWIFTTSD